MESAAASLLDEIVRSPHDVAPRLVYADWLLERHDPRGELIQVQCALDGMPLADPRHARLSDRESDLLRKHARRWLTELGPLGKQGVFRRGFVEDVSTSAAGLAEHGEALMRATPLLALRVSGVTRVRDMEAVLASPVLPQLRSLAVGSGKGLGKRHVALLAACPALARLEQLRLPACLIGDDGIIAITTSPHLGRLVELELSGATFGLVGAEALAAPGGLAALRRLTLGGCMIAARDVYPIVTSARLAALTHLELSTNQLGPQGGGFVAEATALVGLEYLDLSSNELDDLVARKLAGASQYARLHTLRLNGNRITDLGADAFRTTTLPRLVTLEVGPY